MRIFGKSKILRFIVHYFMILIFCILVTLLLYPTLWTAKTSLVHSIFELSCIFISLSSFLLIWNSPLPTSNQQKILGFGLLSVGIYDIFHLYFYPAFQLYPAVLDHVYLIFWMLGRLTEALLLLFCTLPILKKRRSRWVSLCITLTLTLGCSYVVIRYYASLSIILATTDLAFLAILLDAFIITLLFVALIRMHTRFERKTSVNYPYLMMAILLAIPGEITLNIQTAPDSFLECLRHFLKVVSYYFIYKGFYITAVTAPFETIGRTRTKLLESRETLRQVLENHPQGVIPFHQSHKLSDATKQKQLRDLQVQTLTILDSIYSQIAITDRDYVIQFCNPSFQHFYEITEMDVLGQSIIALQQKLQFKILDEAYDEIPSLSSHQTPMQACLVTASGNKKYLLYSSNPILNFKKECIGYVFVSSDMTQLILEQKKTRQQEKLALMGELGSGIVHETKNHLASVKGYCQLLARKIDAPNLLRYIHRIEVISEEINDVIVNFLTLAKPSETNKHAISLRQTIESIRYMLESPSFLRGIQIHFEIDTEEHAIYGDEQQMKQLILNIVKNAIEALDETQNPRLDFILRFNKEKREMQLVISDNGRGISKESLSKIGTPFYSEKEYGTGLGLHTCYRIVKEHHGNIDIQSQWKQGTTFIISLPILQEPKASAS